MLLGLPQDPEVQVVGGCDPRPPTDAASPLKIPITSSIAELLSRVELDVVVDFTTAEAAAQNAVAVLKRGIPMVVGTTGLTDGHLEEIDSLARRNGAGALVAPNFAIGANLMMQFARTASRFFDAAEIIETHHDGKIDSPSGTALATAQAMREARGKPFAEDKVTRHTVEGTRGGVADDVHIHSLRMVGFVASHQVIFGGPGQSLTIRHDSIGRESFVPGVIFAVKNIRGHVGLIRGLDQLIELAEAG